MASPFSEEQFRCTICLDLFNDPVSIPCGHNFCKDCIHHHWMQKHKTDCPICKEVFFRRPDLRVNVALKEITEHFKILLKPKPPQKPVPPKRTLSKAAQPAPDQVTCDTCRGDKQPAVKSCLSCQESYCQAHLTPHLKDPGMMRHQLAAPVASVPGRLCRNHNSRLDLFCKRDLMPVCSKCTEHKLHEVVHIETESKRVKTQVKKTQADFQQMIQSRMKKMEEIKKSLEMNKLSRDRELQASARVFSMVSGALERNQALLVDEIEREHEDVEKRAEGHLNELKQELRELQRRRKELQQLENTEDALLLLQSFPSVSTPLPTRDWTAVTASCNTYVGNIRRSLTKLLNVCSDIERELSAEEFSKTSKYAVDVTLDDGTAACWLDVSPDGKQVCLSSQPKRVPDDPRRFDACVSVLGRQRFTGGRQYWVVQVGDKTDWDLGVARESINRKGAITVRPDNGYWAICRRKGGGLHACAGPSVALALSETPRRVSVFLDYEGGQVSFYNTETKTHIYTYRGCSFTEPLYPYFNPCLHDNGRNTAPLVICPVSIRLSEEAIVF
ncbi:nuclear factor 7, brain-like [Salarias fasciatus]|uniref:Nuclear factor 7, brain-like n=1 Tax=Salarias fasciatus TaxID=181472 RepID=A0A672J4V3_SALFA|nr:nuclear factor 7, brain-like [Salarias fasciatus]